MATLTWKDSRIVASDMAPYNTTVMLAGKSTPIKELVADSVRWCDAASGDMNLMIYCHGNAGSLQLCKEGLALRNIGVLAPLKPYFSTVSIHACLIAKGAVGRDFCRQLARVLYAWVDGAVKLQYNTGIQTLYGWEDDRKFDGDYYRHLPSGEVQGPLRSR